MLALSKTLSLREIIINTCNPMQNPGQTQIFYKVGQIQLTRAKCDPVDPDDSDDPNQLQCWFII